MSAFLVSAYTHRRAQNLLNVTSLNVNPIYIRTNMRQINIFFLEPPNLNPMMKQKRKALLLYIYRWLFFFRTINGIFTELDLFFFIAKKKCKENVLLVCSSGIFVFSTEIISSIEENECQSR